MAVFFSQRAGIRMNRERLDATGIDRALGALNAKAAAPWQICQGKLNKEFHFNDFVDAFGFMAKAALVAEAMNHHPEWLNIYAKVRVDLSTHDAGGITDLDFALAERMELLAR
jgi:4a-hydroxytetrahydrobiopterin dehydratase